ncbi:MAG: LTA synthase family protein [Lachnospiraceae bacterium]|nr:LTA synthase family protein [Lachnospiraceae bacterium]
MSIIWGSLAVLLLYLEVVYHLSGFGFSSFQPLLAIALIVAWSAAITIIVGVVRGRWKKIIYYGFIWIAVIWDCVQLVYLRIFKQPLLWEAVFRGGGDALTNYWREALEGVLGAVPFLLLFMLPAIVLGILMHKFHWNFPQFSALQLLRTAVILVIGVVAGIVTMEVGRAVKADYYESYEEFYDPSSVAETMGILPMLQRDTVLSVSGLFVEAWEADEPEVEWLGVQSTNGTATGESSVSGGENAGNAENTLDDLEEEDVMDVADDEESLPSIHPQQFAIDYEQLHTLADNDKQLWLADYIQGTTPTSTNEYTGMFEGYNLIFLTAEGFSSYAIREDLTPTLYRLVNSGFVFENYYVPIWQTSTSDGEYINCTGLIPDGQFSMRKSSENDMAYTLPQFFASEDVYSYAYHNNTLSYYDRYLTHTNLGYDFKGSKLGNLSEAEWGEQLFAMENPDRWPASDLEMIQGTLPEYVNEERFHVYYMTVSGHMNYNFTGNAMSSKNREAVANLDMSENARAYIACNIELDKALEYLLTELEAAGQLDKTVICLSADHYPYGMTTEQYEELAGKSLAEGKDLFRNSLILWNAQMEEPIYVDKACGSMDLLPTLLNLFGFTYDSRMYAGRDIFAQEEGLVIFNDRSFVTDSVIYDKKSKKTIWLKDAAGNDIVPEEQKESYLSEMQDEVKRRYQFSAFILQENYYQDVKQAIVQEPAS